MLLERDYENVNVVQATDFSDSSTLGPFLSHEIRRSLYTQLNT
jgi:hypothetical protein